mgnify:CR=1 FL=1
MAKKRANGEGNIRKRSDGRWEGRYTAGYHPDTGKRIIKNVLGRTQAEVKAKLKQAIGEAGSLDVVKAGKYTVAEWLRLWFEVYAKPNLRFSTAEYYRRGIELHTIPYIGEVKLNQLTTRHQCHSCVVDGVGQRSLLHPVVVHAIRECPAGRAAPERSRLRQ